MKKINLILLVLVTIYISACNESFTLTVTNSEEHDRPNEIITIPKSSIKIATSPFRILKNGEEIPYQLIDSNEDGNWDELITLLSIQALATDTLYFEKLASPPSYPKTTQVRHRKLLANKTFGEELVRDTMILGLEATDFTKEKLPPYLTEGPSWENDLVGFRLYFDKRNGRDIWGKKTNELVLNHVGTDTTVSYHTLQDWGMDVLKVGGSLGAGGVAFIYKDSIYRLAGDQFESVVYQELYDGPIQSAFKMIYKGFKIHDSIPSMDIEETISITKGQWYYNNHVVVKNAPEGLVFVTGIVNLYDIAFKYLEIEHLIGMYSAGIQSENKDVLAMSVIIDKTNFIGFDEAPSSGTGIVNTHLMKLKLVPEGNEFKFVAMWEGSVTGLNEMEFIDQLNTILYNLAKPLSIKDK